MPNWDVERLYCMDYLWRGTMEFEEKIEMTRQRSEVEIAAQNVEAATRNKTEAEACLAAASKAQQEALRVQTQTHNALRMALGTNNSVIIADKVYSNIGGAMYLTTLKS